MVDLQGIGLRGDDRAEPRDVSRQAAACTGPLPRASSRCCGCEAGAMNLIEYLNSTVFCLRVLNLVDEGSNLRKGAKTAQNARFGRVLRAFGSGLWRS